MCAKIHSCGYQLREFSSSSGPIGYMMDFVIPGVEGMSSVLLQRSFGIIHQCCSSFVVIASDESVELPVHGRLLELKLCNPQHTCFLAFGMTSGLT